MPEDGRKITDLGGGASWSPYTQSGKLSDWPDWEMQSGRPIGPIGFSNLAARLENAIWRPIGKCNLVARLAIANVAPRLEVYSPLCLVDAPVMPTRL